MSGIPREYKSVQQGAAGMLVAAFDPSIAGKVKPHQLSDKINSLTHYRGRSKWRPLR